MEIAQVLNYEDKDKVDELSGTVTQVFEQTTGTFKRGARKGKKWTVQNFMLEDEAGDEIKIGAWNMDDLSELEGQKVTLKRNMTFKDDGEYQSVELGKNTKIIEEGAAEESPSRKRKSAPRENKGKTTSGKSSDERGERMHWGLCLKVAGNVFTGTSEVAAGAKGGILEYARDLYSAVPGSNGQDKVRKFVKKALKEPEPEPEQPDLQGNDSPDDDDDVSL